MYIVAGLTSCISPRGAYLQSELTFLCSDRGPGPNVPQIGDSAEYCDLPLGGLTVLHFAGDGGLISRPCWSQTASSLALLYYSSLQTAHLATLDGVCGLTLGRSAGMYRSGDRPREKFRRSVFGNRPTW